jgi:1-acyl-sn-glycerol-3-phosphate acyltransferase
LPEKPVVVVLNHPSWWDPLICLILSDLFPGRNHFAPIDSEALEQYRFFARLGFFGIRPRSVSGGRVFLRTGEAILSDSRSMLWVTAQGRFADVRERPLTLEGGVGHLLARCPHAVALPLALELTFWNERLPEALARFGEPMHFDISLSPKEWTRALEAALEHNLDALAEAARRRDAEAFVTLLRGRQSVAFFYDLWRATRNLLTGNSPQRGHP